MTVFMTPLGEPFYAGTYFPDRPRHGMPGFGQLLGAIAEAWRGKRSDVVDQGRRVADALRRGQARATSKEPLIDAILVGAARGLAGAFDPAWGGFGGPPKFPQPMSLEFMLRMHLRGVDGALDIVTRTLDRMADGGVHDQLGGGFHRYSVDGMWHVPHFEKMLYDNAQLARLYLHAYQVAGDERYRTVTVTTLNYLLEEMHHEGGGFFASQDADSEGVEGRFFVWSYDEIVDAARTVEADFLDGGAGDEDRRRTLEQIAACPPELVATSFGALPDGNWDGTNVLWTPIPLHRVAADAGVEERGLRGRIATATRILLEARGRRVRPATDDKILAAWNGLAISAFAEAARVLGPTSGYLQPAIDAATFVLTRMRDSNGRLQRSWRDGRTSGPGFLDDHAMMAAACLELYRSTFDPRWMREARALAGEMVRLFDDPENEGFFQTGTDAEALLTRPKELFDNAIPSGNSVAADVLLRLALYTGDARLERLGVSALRATGDLLAKAPSAFGHALGALDLHLSDAREIAIVGEAGTARDALEEVLRRRYLPNTVVAAALPGDDAAAAAVPLLAGRTVVGGHAAAYVCEGFVCRMPVTTPEDFAEQLDLR
jgi:uncharacterized protein YyaL (SSP411 family)